MHEGEVLQAYMRRNKLRQQDVADAIKAERSSVAYYVKTEHFRSGTRKKLLKAYPDLFKDVHQANGAIASSEDVTALKQRISELEYLVQLQKELLGRK